MNKILLINKPEDWTSFDVVAKIRSIYSKREGKKIKVGHAGTLDPFATGLLIILIGSATKEQDKFMKLDKEYEAILKLGYESDTGDPEGALSKTISSKNIEPVRKDIERVLKKFTGKIEQTPPAHSAIKIDGKRAYELARAGKKVKMKSRKVTIYDIEVINYKYPKLEIRTKVSSGTYIRSLAQDIGKGLGCGAYLIDLKRTKIGDYDLEDAKEITGLK